MDGLIDDWKADYTITIIKIAHMNNRLTCKIPANLVYLYVPHYHNNTIFFTVDYNWKNTVSTLSEVEINK